MSYGPLAMYNALEDFLKSHGAKSRHLFPVKGLPGYNEVDMEEWIKITENKAKSTSVRGSMPSDSDNAPQPD